MSPTIGADVPEDLKERVDDAREKDESRSAAVRRLLRKALDQEATENRLIDSVVTGGVLAAFLLFTLGVVEMEAALFAAAVASFLLAFVANRYSVEISRYVK